MAEVEISYKGSNIATMNASGTKTLLTEAKYLEDDVTVTYTRPAAPSGTKNISITANGQTTEDVAAYASAQITANVPNTYAAGDEGKVVSNGALVAQGSRNIDTNGTYDTTTNNEVTVNVSGGGGISVDDLAKGTEPSGSVTLSPTTTSVHAYAFRSNSVMTHFNAPGVTSVGGNAFESCSALETLTIGGTMGTSSLGSYAFRNSSNLEEVHFPKAKDSFGFGGNGLQGLSKLRLIDYGAANACQFNSLPSCPLNVIILRKTSGLQSLTSGALNNSAAFKSGGTGGTIYIPQVLYDHLGDGGSLDYKAASNWSTYQAYGTITWAKIEGSIYELT